MIPQQDSLGPAALLADGTLYLPVQPSQTTQEFSGVSFLGTRVLHSGQTWLIDQAAATPDLKLMQVSLKRGTDSIEPSSPRELFALPIAHDGFSPYEVASDGQRFLVRTLP